MYREMETITQSDRENSVNQLIEGNYLLFFLF